MIQHELILLGLLKESPKHGYEIKQRIGKILGLFAGIDPKSIYYPLKVLEKQGLILKQVVQSGKRPKRMVYGLTPKGEARFDEMLSKSFLNFKRPQFSLDLSLFFLDYIKPDIARRRLRGRMRVLSQLSKGLRQTARSLRNERPRSLAYILEHNLQMVDTELNFLSRLTKTL
ncbi:MAG: PadR family transcriptional regulator [Candidatus Omnitrophota bacterium]